MAQERDARARYNRRGVREALPRQGERIQLLPREDDVGDVRSGGEESGFERSGKGRKGARRHEDANAAWRSRNARRQPPAPATALRVNAVEGHEVRRRRLGVRLEERRQGGRQIDTIADDVQDGTAEIMSSGTN